MLRATRLRTIGATALCTFGGALLLPLGYRALLPMPERLGPVLLIGYLAGAALITLSVAVASWVALWPATPYLDLPPEDPAPRGAEPREAKAAALAFPSRVAGVATIAGELAVAAGWLALTVAGESSALVLSLSLTTAVLVGICWLLIYTLSQGAVRPLLLRLRDESAPPPSLLAGLSLRGRLAYTLSVVVAAGVLPGAVLGSAYLDHTYEASDQAHALRTAQWLTQAARGLEQKSAQQMAESVPLSQGFPITLIASPQGEPARGAVLARLPGAKIVQLPYGQARERPLGMLVAVALLLGLAAVLALGMGGVVTRDLYALITQAREYADAQAVQLHGDHPTTTAEAQPVEEALDRLMARMRRLHVDSYLAIERTIDARRAKSQFLASMSHDLRSPLSSVLGFAELLTSGYEGNIPEPARLRLQHIHKTGRRLLRLLSEILDTAKVESQTIELHPRRCAPAELLAQAISEARRGRMQEDLPVQLDLQQGLRPIHVDPVRFPQALAHLIGHVLDSVPEGSGTHQLRVSAREGRGPDRGQIFEVEVAIERTPAAKEGPESLLPLGTVGLGLALPLARRLIALHGGTLELQPGPRPSVRAVVPIRLQ